MATHAIYRATLNLLAHKNYDRLNLYEMTIETAEFQLLLALWKHFGFNESINKEKLLNCKTALGCQSACKNDPVSAPNFDPLLSLHIERQLITFDS